MREGAVGVDVGDVTVGRWGDGAKMRFCAMREEGDTPEADSPSDLIVLPVLGVVGCG